MSRLMSVAFTEAAVRNRTKTVTRRKGWWTDKNGRHMVKPGDRLTLCRKVMGRKKGEPLERICDVEVTSVTRERLGDISYLEVCREGFTHHTPESFVREFFIDAQGMNPDDIVTRIEWEYVTPCGCGDRYPDREDSTHYSHTIVRTAA